MSSLGIDTPILIYFVEENPTYLARAQEVIRLVDEGALSGFASVLALTEVLTIPLRAGDAGIAASYRNLLRNSRHFSLASVNEAVAELASDLRARHNLKTPDAIHVASAIVSVCDTFITNDRMLSRVTEIRVMVLEDLTA